MLKKKKENRVTFRIKTGQYLEHLTLETMKLLGNSKSEITNDENGENLPHLEITEVILVHCNVANNDYEQSSAVLYILVPNKSFDQLLDISPKAFIVLKPLIRSFHILKYDLLIKILNR